MTKREELRVLSKVEGGRRDPMIGGLPSCCAVAARESFLARIAAGGAPKGRPGGTSRGATAGVKWRTGTAGRRGGREMFAGGVVGAGGGASSTVMVEGVV